MVERKDPATLRREPREGELTDLQAEILQERALGVGKLKDGFLDAQESDEDA